jgi:hypothetical protein
MGAKRRLVEMLVGVAGVVVLTACGGGNPMESAAGVRKATGGEVARQAPTTAARPAAAPATTVSGEPVPPRSGPATPARPKPKPKATTDPAPAPTSTSTSTTTPVAAPVPDVVVVPPHGDHIGEQPGLPRLIATPDNAPAGTRVRVEGYGFVGDPWQTSGGHLWLAIAGGQLECELYAQAEHDVHVSPDGHLTGSFVVPPTGVCRYSGGEMSTAGHWYDIAYQCTVCRVGTFSVAGTAEPVDRPAGTNCGVVSYMGGAAGTYYADGLPCPEARSLLDGHAASWVAASGPHHVDAHGFSCDRVRQSSLRRATYKCTRGSQAIWWATT